MAEYRFKQVSNNLITELAFRLIMESEEIEHYEFDDKNIESNTGHLKHINKNLVLEFLSDSNTKVTVRQDQEINKYYLIASNNLSHESIKISGLADHYLALLKVVESAAQKRFQLRNLKKQTPLLDREFIEQVNLSLHPFREEEAGIGEYRPLAGGIYPVESHLLARTKDGIKKIDSLKLTPQKDVEKEMEKLINWVNLEAFKPGRDKLHDVAEFHARFIKIHPFTDGNGRTARLLSNYLLLVHNLSPVSFPIEHKQEYIGCLNYFISNDFVETSEQVLSFDKFIRTKHLEREREGFLEYLLSKQYKLRNKGKSYKITNKTDGNKRAATIMQKQRANTDPFHYLTEFLRKHQINISSRKAIGNILNNYGNKSEGQHINVGNLLAEQTDYISF